MARESLPLAGDRPEPVFAQYVGGPHWRRPVLSAWLPPAVYRGRYELPYGEHSPWWLKLLIVTGPYRLLSRRWSAR